MTLRNVEFKLPLDHDIPEKYRITNSNFFAARLNVELKWDGEPTHDWITFDDMRGDDDMSPQRWFLSSPYRTIHPVVHCVCSNTALLLKEQYALLSKLPTVVRTERLPNDGLAPVKLLAMVEAGVPTHLNWKSNIFGQRYIGPLPLDPMVCDNMSGKIEIQEANDFAANSIQADDSLAAQITLDLTPRLPVAVLAIIPDKNIERPTVVVLAYGRDGSRIPGYQYNFPLANCVLWFPRTPPPKEEEISLTVLYQHGRGVQFTIAPPTDLAPFIKN